MRYIFTLYFFCLIVTAYAQNDTIRIGNGKDQKAFSLKVARAYRDSINNSHIGEAYVPFLLNTLDGQSLNNESVKGKVLFIAFWYESCNCWNYKKLEEFYNSMKDDPGFVFVAITFEGNSIQEFLKAQQVDFPIARVRYEADAQLMNYHNGFPSFIIIDKEGKVAAVYALTVLQMMIHL